MSAFLNRLANGAALIALSFSTIACAQTQQTPTPVASTQVAAETVEMAGPGLWKVADEDTTIYMFGTIHLLPDNIKWKTDAIRDALASAQTLVTEVDMTDEAMAAMGPMVASKAMLPQGETLRAMLNDEQRAAYEGALEKLGMPAAALDPFEPWFAALQMANLAYVRNGMNPDLGVEEVLESAVGPNVGRDALETMEFQLAIFDELPVELQIKYLVETATEIDEVGPMLDKMIAEWAVGDAEDLGALLNEALESDPVMAERLLYARNANWAVWIDERLDTPGTVFMAVGAGHLAGVKSVQDLLAARGIATIRVQ